MSTTRDTPPDGDFAALMALLDRMASTESWTLSDDDLLGRMDGYGVAIDRLHGMRLHTIRDVDDRRLCEDLGSYATSDRITLADRTTPAPPSTRSAPRNTAAAGDVAVGEQADRCVLPDVEDDRLAKQVERQERQSRRNRYLTWGLDGEGSFFFRGKLPELMGRNS